MISLDETQGLTTALKCPISAFCTFPQGPRGLVPSSKLGRQDSSNWFLPQISGFSQVPSFQGRLNLQCPLVSHYPYRQQVRYRLHTCCIGAIAQGTPSFALTSDGRQGLGSLSLHSRTAGHSEEGGGTLRPQQAESVANPGVATLWPPGLDLQNQSALGTEAER